MKRLIALCMLVSVGFVAGCNTMAGAGRDIERGGEKMQEKARDAQR